MAGSDTDTAFTGSIQPARGRDLERLPEGMRSTEAIRIITRTALQLSAPDTQRPDQCDYGSNTYEVGHVERWTSTPDVYDAIAVRLGD